MRLRGRLAVLAVLGVVCLSAVASPAVAQPTASQLLADLGLSDGDRQKVLNGEFVTPDVTTLSDRDLAVNLVFLVKMAPEMLSKEVMGGDALRGDSQARTHGRFSTTGSLADLVGLRISDDVAQRFTNAQPGEALNLSNSEITAFTALKGGTTQAAQGQLQKMLLTRYQAYRASGLAGFAPYDRGSGRTSDSVGDLRKTSQTHPLLEKYMPGFQKALLDYPKATVPSMQEDFRWVYYDIQGKPTYVLVHMISGPEGPGRAVAQRQYYVSTGYNVQQAVAAFMPIQGGTLVAYSGHAFTDQVTGFGGSLKRSIGRHMMTEKLEALFNADRNRGAK
jgi:hypothetical protein